VARSATVIAPTAWARLAARRAVSIARGNARASVVAPHERLLGLALGVALLGFATALVALIVVLLWLCR
jgi:hypothetical protein